MCYCRSSGIARGRLCPLQSFRGKILFIFQIPYFQTITGGWGEAAGEEGFVERDMILKPDISTAAAPWTGDWTLQVIHDAFDRKDEPIPLPQKCFKVVSLYHEKGWDPIVAPEMEFFLVARNLILLTQSRR